MINFKKYKYWFTLVELVVSVAIILVLATIAFLVFSKWIWNSKDSRRVGDIATLEKSLELGFTTNPSWMFPLPDDSIEVVSELDGNLWIQWYFGEWVKGELDNIEKLPVDPRWTNYEYSVTPNRLQYQVMAILENWYKLSYFVNKTYWKSKELSYIKWFYDGYLISKNPDKTYTLVSSPTLFVRNEIIRNSWESWIYKSHLLDEIIDINKSTDESAQVLTWDITTFFNRVEDTETMLMIEEKFPSILQEWLLNNLITSAWWNISTLVVKSACFSWENLWFQFGNLKNWEYVIVKKDTDIPNWIIQDSMKWTCNNWNYVYSEIQSEKICFDTHVLYNGNCVLDICEWEVPLHWEQNWTQKVWNIREYDLNPWICKYKCVDWFHLENWICVDNIKIVDCWWTFVENSINNSTGSLTYNKIWNWTFYAPLYLDWDYDENPWECKFVCNTDNITLWERYYWDWDSCELLWTPTLTLFSKTDTQISLKWDRVTNADSYAVKNWLWNRNVIGNLTWYVFEWLNPWTAYNIQVVAVKTYNWTTVHSNVEWNIQVTTNCASWYHFEWEQCVTNNCNSVTKTVWTHQYVLPAINDGNIFTGSSQPISIDNWTIIYNQSFQCNLWAIVEVWIESHQIPVCNSWYSPSWNSCVMNTYSISGSFGANGSGAAVTICGIETVADSSWLFAISAIPEWTNCNNALATKTNYSCTVSINWPTSIVSNITNVSWSCVITRIWSWDAANWFVYSEWWVNKYPTNCNDLLVSSTTNFKRWTTLPWNWTKFVDGYYYIKIWTSTQFKAYCDMTTDGWWRTAIVKDYNTSISYLQKFWDVSYIDWTFYNNATYWIWWWTNDSNYKTYIINSNLLFSNMRIKYTWRYDSAWLWEFRISTLNWLNWYSWWDDLPSQWSTLLRLTDSNTDNTRWQTLSVNWTTIFTSTLTNVLNREDTLDWYWRYITMTWFTSAYYYNKRFISYLYVK